jgi:hypothetical protein
VTNDIDTEKIRRVAKDAIDLHAAQCPGPVVVARVEAALGILTDEMKAAREEFGEGKVRFERLEAKDREHDRDVETVGARVDKCEAFIEEMRSFFAAIAKRIIVAVIVTIASALGLSHGISAIIQILGG